jgi:DNA-binding transcriptional ArsR family regulator
VRTLVSTFADGDDDKVLLAMRKLPYDRLVLIGLTGADGPSYEKLLRLERLSGHDVDFREIVYDSFMAMVDSISEELSELGVGRGSKDEIIMNISGGSKIMGDAALFAAFRLGIETYHCDRVVVKLPILKGATAKDRFTDLQVRLVDLLSRGEVTFGDVIEKMRPNSRASAERTIRDLKKMRLIKVRLEAGNVFLGLSPEGVEVARATRFARGL